jgi:predicted O-methyltransferase YrrM
MTRRRLDLDDRLYSYLLEHSLRESEVQQRLRAETARLPESSMQIPPEQGQLLRLLTELIGARNAIEVGTFTGYSALCIALGLPPEGRLLACDVSSEWTKLARRMWTEAGVEGKIELALGPALQTLDDLLAGGSAGEYDLAFIDADKTSYALYYERLLRLVRPGGLIAIDNVLWGGRVADPSAADEDTAAIRALNERIHADERVGLSMLPIGDGLTLVRRR